VDEVEEWLARLPDRLDYLGDFHIRDRVVLDFTGDSLAGVEGYLLDWFATADGVPGDEEGEWVFEGVAGYLGEVLLRLAGGAWRAPAVRGVALIGADEALGLAPLSTADLVLAAVRDRTGAEFGRAYADWDRAVQAYQRSHPGWTPTKTPTPGVDPVELPPADIDHLAGWLAERERDFARWSAAYGTGTTWDFSARSLDELGALVLRRIPTSVALDDPANRAFVEGAEWYAGEVWRRAKGGRWVYRHGDPNVNMFDGYPFVERTGLAAVPHFTLLVVVEQRDPHHLYRQYEGFAG